MTEAPKKYPWEGKIAVIIGASAGLGSHLTIALAKQRARLLLVARDRTRLEFSKEKALAAGASHVDILPLDISQPTNATPLREFATSQGVDLLIHAVGKSDRGHLLQLSHIDLEELFRLNVLSAFQANQQCLEGLKKRKGCIVHIASLASKLAPPGLGGYAVTKFGLTAMSHQLRYELEAFGIHSLLVCPGPIQREDSGRRYDTLISERGLSEEAQKPGGGANLKLIDPVWLANRILLAAQNREIELIVPGKVRWLTALAALWPALADRFLNKKK